MKAIAATEKTKIAIRNAYNYLGGDDLSNESTGHMLNGKFDTIQNKYYNPFQIEILRYPSGQVLHMHEGKLNIFNDVSRYTLTFSSQDIFPLINLSNGSETPSGIWDVVLSVQSEFIEIPSSNFVQNKTHMFLCKEGQAPLSSGFNFPATNGIYSTVIGKIEKRILSNAYPESSDPNAYWEVINQYVNTNLDIYLNNSYREFAITCACNISGNVTRELAPLGYQLTLNDFDINVETGGIMIGNEIQEISGINFTAGSIEPSTSGTLVYIDIDLNNLSASFIDTYDSIQKPFQQGHYFWYLGKIWTNNNPLFIYCSSENYGPVRIPYTPYIIPSGQTILCVNDGQLSGIPLSAGFLEVVSGSVSGNVTYNIQFTEATECEDE